MAASFHCPEGQPPVIAQPQRHVWPHSRAYSRGPCRRHPRLPARHALGRDAQRHHPRNPRHLCRRPDNHGLGRGQAENKHARPRRDDSPHPHQQHPHRCRKSAHSPLNRRARHAHAQRPRHPQLLCHPCAQREHTRRKGPVVGVARHGTDSRGSRRREADQNRTLRPQHRHRHPQRHLRARHNRGGARHAPARHGHRLVLRPQSRATAARHQPHGHNLALLHPPQHRHTHRRCRPARRPVRDRIQPLGACHRPPYTPARLPRDILLPRRRPAPHPRRAVSGELRRALRIPHH